ncbi:N-acetylglucosamine kinase [Jiella sp. M17.18]|uniref:N-acetylglucosamine kinase n=1 Tax=Jiella sp. M17.18 TaxID=3234247 RepID=UPI0034DF41F6
MLAIGFDIGGTKTRARVVAEDGSLLADYAVATDEWRLREDQNADARRLAGIVSGLAGRGGDLRAIAIGSHGCDTDEECTALADRLSRLLPADVLVVNDAELLLPASGFTDGIAVVSGTGSIAVTRDRQHRLMTAGGWGWYLGDEGSATGLVRAAARLVRAAQDAGRLDDPLIVMLCDAYGARRDGTDLGSRISRLGSAAAIGEHARIIFDALRMGSGLARAAIDDGASALSDKVATLAARGAGGKRIVTGGSVIAGQPEFAAAFADAIRLKLNGWSLHPFVGPPVEGAVALARCMLHGESLGNLPSPRRHGSADD